VETCAARESAEETTSSGGVGCLFVFGREGIGKYFLWKMGRERVSCPAVKREGGPHGLSGRQGRGEGRKQEIA